MDADFKKKIFKLRKIDSRYEADAYTFIMECFRFSSGKKTRTQTRNLKAREICEAVKDLALENFGPMAGTVLSEWGVKNTADIGQLVKGLVEVKILAEEADDSYDLFNDLFDFHEVFEKPYEPK